MPDRTKPNGDEPPERPEAESAGQEGEGRVVPWLEPSSFEIAAMARLRTMLPAEIVDAIEAEREKPEIAMSFDAPPEVFALLAEIIEDRIVWLIAEGKLDDGKAEPTDSRTPSPGSLTRP